MKKLFSIIASALLLVSCADRSKDVDTPFQAGQKVTLCASIASGDDAANAPQRVSGKDSNPGSTTGVVDLTWDAGDKVLVKVDDKSSVFTLTSGAGTSEGSFYGEMPGEGSYYDVVYPADYSEDVLAVQTYVENGFGKGLMKMSTKTRGTVEGGFTLSADNALLGLQLAGNDEIGKIVLTDPDNEKTYTLKCPGITLTSTSTMFYIVVPGHNSWDDGACWNFGFIVDVYATDNKRIINRLEADNPTYFEHSTARIMPVQDVSTVKTVGFSVSAEKQVTFSPGNLQYTHSTNTWSFAENQYDMLGQANIELYYRYNEHDDKTYEYHKLADKLDLFSWSGSTSTFQFGAGRPDDPWNYPYPDENEDCSGTFIDWGTNKIGSDAPNTWRTLTKDEWDYLLNRRQNASTLITVAQVNGVNGLILFPDNWVWVYPLGVPFKLGFPRNDYTGNSYANYQTFTIDQWSKLEEAGAIFLPAAGARNCNIVSDEQDYGYYWCAGEDVNEVAIRSGIDVCIWDASIYRFYGRSVRLVKDL